MAATSNGTIRDHSLAFAEKKGSGRYLTFSKQTGSGTQTASVIVGALAAQTGSVEFSLGGTDSVIDAGTSPGYVYFIGELTPNPTSAAMIRIGGTRIWTSSELIVVGLPPTSGTEAKEFLYFLGDEGSSMTVEIDAASSVSGQVESQSTTTLGTYIKVITNTNGKRQFAYNSAQTIPTSTSDPVRQCYDEVTGYASDVGIDV